MMESPSQTQRLQWCDCLMKQKLDSTVILKPNDHHVSPASSNKTRKEAWPCVPSRKFNHCLSHSSIFAPKHNHIEPSQGIHTLFSFQIHPLRHPNHWTIKLCPLCIWHCQMNDRALPSTAFAPCMKYAKVLTISKKINKRTNVLSNHSSTAANFCDVPS